MFFTVAEGKIKSEPASALHSPIRTRRVFVFFLIAVELRLFLILHFFPVPLPLWLHHPHCFNCEEFSSHSNKWKIASVNDRANVNKDPFLIGFKVGFS